MNNIKMLYYDTFRMELMLIRQTNQKSLIFATIGIF